MEISKELEKIINEQINKEFYSEYLYLSMSAYFDSQNLGGIGSWLRAQAFEEREHAMKFFAHLTDRNGTVRLAAIDAPKALWKSPADAFADSYAHEQQITKSIYSIKDAARKTSDYATVEFLNWFVAEQVEEEKTAYEIWQKLKMSSGSPGALLAIDHEMGARAKK